MKYLIYTPFRCGSSYLARFIERNSDAPIQFRSTYIPNTEFPDTIVKGHTGSISFAKDFDYLFTCIRKPTEIFMSAFIKDMKTEGYPYYYDKEVSEENLPDMIDYFLSFSWENFEWLSYDYNFLQLYSITDMNIWNEPFNKNFGYTVYDSTPKIVAITHNTLFNDERLPQLQLLFSSELKFKRIRRDQFSYRNSDTYPDLYQKFINGIPEKFFKKYRYLDDRIKDKFLI